MTMAANSSDIEIIAEAPSRKRPIEISSDSGEFLSDSDAGFEIREATRPSQRAKTTANVESIAAPEPQSTSRIESPIKLTKINALPASENVGAVGLRDLIGAPDLTTMWQFNFSIDIPFVMEHVHPRALPTLKAHFVTGEKAGDDTKEMLLIQSMLCVYPDNISVHTVLLQKRYASHHTKMMVLGFGPGPAQIQIVIHTANLKNFDWDNMTQGVWVSPRLSRLEPSQTNTSQFFSDFCDYLYNYGNITTGLVQMLRCYDFAPIRAVLIASVPCSARKGSKDYTKYGLHRLHAEVAKLALMGSVTDHIVANVSAISSLGPTNDYLINQVFRALNGSTANREPDIVPKIIFPTVQDVMDSLNGFDSGIAIHYRQSQFYMKAQTRYLKSYLHVWAAERAGRARAAPHIKTYLRVDSTWSRIKWFLLTSANLSKQAWGIESKAGIFEVQSFELGVLLHPGLFSENDDASCVDLVPVWKNDDLKTQKRRSSGPAQAQTDTTGGVTTITPARIPIRMAYDLPPEPYVAGRDRAWDSSVSYEKEDWRGGTWRV
jgi:tyrosyl-DNA phosphodiesterase-1